MQDYYRLIGSSLEKISKERKELVDTLHEACTKFNEDEIMYKLSKRYMKMFNVKDLIIPASDTDDESDDENEENPDNEEEHVHTENEESDNEKNENEEMEYEMLDSQIQTQTDDGNTNDQMDTEKVKTSEKDEMEAEGKDRDDVSAEKEKEPEEVEPEVEKIQETEPAVEENEPAVEEHAVEETAKDKTHMEMQETQCQTPPRVNLTADDATFWDNFETPEAIKKLEETKKTTQEDDFWDTHISSGEDIDETIKEAKEKSPQMKRVEPSPTIDAKSDTPPNSKQKTTRETARKSVSPTTKKMTRQSARKSYTPPSFSLGLGLSQLETKEDAENKNKSEKENPTEEKKEVEEHIGEKRVRKPSRFLVSPYNNKKTEVKRPATADEMMVTDEMFSMLGDPM